MASGLFWVVFLYSVSPPPHTPHPPQPQSFHTFCPRGSAFCRYWHITNGAGVVQEVRGPGVVGAQPELAPGESFSYTSCCPLPTPRGRMGGHFEFYRRDEAGTWRYSFLAQISQFALRAD